MRSQVVLCISISLLLPASVASAATVWNPPANGIVPPATGDWGVGANWTKDVPGIADSKAVFNVPDAAECVVTDTQSFAQLVQADNGPGGVIHVVNGGSLTTTGGWMAVGYNDTATVINVFSDHCEAAKSLPGWTAIPGGINLDCVVDQKDLDDLLEQRLNCNGLDCPDIDPDIP